jgi:hypothetical protein
MSRHGAYVSSNLWYFKLLHSVLSYWLRCSTEQGWSFLLVHTNHSTNTIISRLQLTIDSFWGLSMSKQTCCTHAVVPTYSTCTSVTSNTWHGLAIYLSTLMHWAIWWYSWMLFCSVAACSCLKVEVVEVVWWSRRLMWADGLTTWCNPIVPPDATDIAPWSSLMVLLPACIWQWEILKLLADVVTGTYGKVVHVPTLACCCHIYITNMCHIFLCLDLVTALSANHIWL